MSGVKLKLVDGGLIVTAAQPVMRINAATDSKRPTHLLTVTLLFMFVCSPTVFGQPPKTTFGTWVGGWSSAFGVGGFMAVPFVCVLVTFGFPALMFFRSF